MGGKECGTSSQTGDKNGATKRNGDKRYSLQRVYKMEQKAQPPARLGSKIASNLNKQKVENLMTETGSGFYNRNHPPPAAELKKKKHKNNNNVSNTSDTMMIPQLPIANGAIYQQANNNSSAAAQHHQTKDSFDERLDRIIMETMNERETIEY